MSDFKKRGLQILGVMDTPNGKVHEMTPEQQERAAAMMKDQEKLMTEASKTLTDEVTAAVLKYNMMTDTIVTNICVGYDDEGRANIELQGGFLVEKKALGLPPRPLQ